jgi:hypothetical protein
MPEVMPNKSAQIKTHLNEYVKTFTSYDPNGRPLRVITARHDAPAGEVAVATQYTYDGASTRVAYLLEYEILWDAAWDLAVFPTDAINVGRHP